MKRILTDIIGVAILVGLFIGLNYVSYRRGRVKGRSEAIESIIYVHDTLVRYDTLTRLKPVYLTSTVVDSIPYPVVVHDTDTLWAQLPRTEREYGDSTYYAVVSGVEPSLDRIDVFQKTQYITNTNVVTQYRNPRFSLGVQAGYGVSKAGLSPYIGVGISYNIINIKGRP